LIGYLLLVICYWLSVIGLPVIGLPVIGYLLLVICYWLSVIGLPVIGGNTIKIPIIKHHPNNQYTSNQYTNNQ